MTQRHFEETSHTEAYSKYRPLHPKRIIDRILSFLKEKYVGPLSCCVDVGCGSGQATGLFAEHFGRVLGTDVSPGQIEFAQKGKFPRNVEFKVSPAEVIPLPDNSVQLVNSAQACHWFDLPVFLNEADRVLCNSGVIALYGHGRTVFLHEDQEKAERLFQLGKRYYSEETAGFWGSGIEELDNEYRNIHLPYEEVIREDVWSDPEAISLEGFVQYVSTWSGFNNFKKHHGEEAGLSLLRKLTDEARGILETEAEPRDIPLRYKRRYFLLMGRKS